MATPTDVVEVERIRAAATAELSHNEVKPIQSDYHFFVKANISKFKELAEHEVRKVLKPDETLDPYLLNTNLNTRLKHAWEVLSAEEREIYAAKEEEDRRRFMEEDEIASRHCATLTARGKAAKVEKEERQSSETAASSSRGRDLPEMSKIEKLMDATTEEGDGPSEQANSVLDDSSTINHSPPTEDDTTESPPKKSRIGEDDT
jgi:hypothetical protein